MCVRVCPPSPPQNAILERRSVQRHAKICEFHCSPQLAYLCPFSCNARSSPEHFDRSTRRQSWGGVQTLITVMSNNTHQMFFVNLPVLPLAGWKVHWQNHALQLTAGPMWPNFHRSQTLRSVGLIGIRSGILFAQQLAIRLSTPAYSPQVLCWIICRSMLAQDSGNDQWKPLDKDHVTTLQRAVLWQHARSNVLHASPCMSWTLSWIRSALNLPFMAFPCMGHHQQTNRWVALFEQWQSKVCWVFLEAMCESLVFLFCFC